MSRRRRYRKGSGAGSVIAGILLSLLIVVLFGVMLFLRKPGAEAQQHESAVEAPDYDNAEKWSEGVISHNGQRYRYNKNIRTYLFMGIDTDEPVHKAEDGISGG